MKYLFDSNVLRYYLAKHPKVLKNIAKFKLGAAAIPSIVLAEQMRGRYDALLKAEPHRLLQEQERLRETLNMLADFEILYLDEKAMKAFADLRKKVSTKKRYADVIIAAMASVDDHIVVTRNVDDFKDLLPATRIQNWVDRLY